MWIVDLIGWGRYNHFDDHAHTDVTYSMYVHMHIRISFHNTPQKYYSSVNTIMESFLYLRYDRVRPLKREMQFSENMFENKYSR